MVDGDDGHSARLILVLDEVRLGRRRGRLDLEPEATRSASGVRARCRSRAAQCPQDAHQHVSLRCGPARVISGASRFFVTPGRESSPRRMATSWRGAGDCLRAAGRSPSVAETIAAGTRSQLPTVRPRRTTRRPRMSARPWPVCRVEPEPAHHAQNDLRDVAVHRAPLRLHGPPTARFDLSWAVQVPLSPTTMGLAAPASPLAARPE